MKYIFETWITAREYKDNLIDKNISDPLNIYTDKFEGIVRTRMEEMGFSPQLDDIEFHFVFSYREGKISETLDLRCGITSIRSICGDDSREVYDIVGFTPLTYIKRKFIRGLFEDIFKKPFESFY